MSLGRLGLLLTLLALAVPAIAAADEDRDDGDDVRVTASCTGGATATLRLRERDDDRVRLDFELRDRRRAGAWLVVVVHERRLAFRGRLPTDRSSGTARLRRTFRDLVGEDAVRVRASGPRGTSCSVSATLED